MAEPLLRRTFSRLRGRDRPRGKKEEAKEKAPPAPAPCPGAPPTEPCPAPGPERREEEEEEEEDEEGAAQMAGGLGGPGRPPGPGAYLQSLERSSRRWVLSGAKGPGIPAGIPGIPAGPAGLEGGNGAGHIWYNPIPEDEDPRPGGETPERARARAEEEEEEAAARAPSGGQPPPPPSPPSSPPKCPAVPKPPKSPGTVRRLSLRMKKLPELRRKLSLRCPRPSPPSGGSAGHGGCPSPPESHRESRTVITRYHLDTSVGSPRARGAVAPARGGHGSDGDSPELCPPPRAPPELDLGAFQPYGCQGGHPTGVVSGLLSVHLRGLRPPRAGHEPRGLFCVLRVDGASRARTALLALPGGHDFLALDHSFRLQLEGARQLGVLVFAWDPRAGRHRLCCHGGVELAPVCAGDGGQQLAVPLQPGGVLYSKLTLVERWEAPAPRCPRVFGVQLAQLVQRERQLAQLAQLGQGEQQEQDPAQVPLIVQKCLAEIELRGLKVVGLYRLCGSAAVKKELREAFERDSATVTLSERDYPDINVITGILKDFLRELPTPLVPPRLHQVVLQEMAQRPPRDPPGDAPALLECLPPPEKATLRRLLDHLALVASFHPFNRMTPQNLAVCFGPVLMPPGGHTCPGEPPCAGRGRHAPPGHAHGQVDFKSHIEVLHYLLRAWPAPPRCPSPPPRPSTPAPGTAPPPPGGAPPPPQGGAREPPQQPLRGRLERLPPPGGTGGHRPHPDHTWGITWDPLEPTWRGITWRGIT